MADPQTTASAAKLAIIGQCFLVAGWIVLFAAGVRTYFAESVLALMAIGYFLGTTAGRNGG